MVTNVMLSICVWEPTKPINKQDELHAKSYYVRKQCCQNNPWQNKFWLDCTHRLLICQHTADEELSCHLFFFSCSFGCSKVLMGKRGCGYRQRICGQITMRTMPPTSTRAHWVSPLWLFQHMLVGDDGGREQCRHRQTHTQRTRTPPSSPRHLANSLSSSFTASLSASFASKSNNCELNNLLLRET